jgi:hypothetical protein
MIDLVGVDQMIMFSKLGGVLGMGDGEGALIKKEKKIFFIYKEIQSRAVAKSYMRKGFLTYEEMRKYFPIYEKAVSHI